MKWIEVRDEVSDERAYFNPEAVTSVVVAEGDLLYYVRIADMGGRAFHTAAFSAIEDAVKCAEIIVDAFEAGRHGVSIVIGEDRKTSVLGR
jgi:hypothetical protein